MRIRARTQSVIAAGTAQPLPQPFPRALFRRIKKRIFAIPEEEAEFSRRGFRRGDPLIQQRLEKAGRCFLAGYHAAMLNDDGEAALISRLAQVEEEFRGFSYEGAAMGLTMLDALMPWQRRRLKGFLEGPGSAHIYMVSVGAGWAAARLPWVLNPLLGRLHPLLRWLAVDGYGFHEGYFHRHRSIDQRRIPRRLRGYARRAFDQGLGRSLWFVECADIEAATYRINGFAQHRRDDLWSGFGLACAYAGALQEGDLNELCNAAGRGLPALAQGIAFAAKARLRAGNLAGHTERACRAIWGMSARQLVQLTDKAASELPPDGRDPAYEIWRQRVQQRFAGKGADNG